MRRRDGEETLAHVPPVRLDNAAKIFPGMLSRRRTTIFRLAATIDEAVDVARLQRAYDAMLDRCPYFHVELRRGLFWYYFERSDVRPRVEAESRFPCMYIPFKRRGVLPFRLIAYRNRVAFEVSHAVTDGSGALTFLNSVLAEYFRLRGEAIEAHDAILDPRDPPKPGESEDSFSRQYRRGMPPAPRAERALRFEHRAYPPPEFYVIDGTVATREVRALAQRYGVTIGEYLTALLIAVAQDEMYARDMKERPIRISIPINLRRFFGSTTMRNFVLSVEPGIDPRLGRFEFTDIVAKVHHFMRSELDHRFIRRQIVRNVKSERNVSIRVLPVFVKDPILRLAYSLFGTRLFTVGFSNLGKVRLPPTMERFIQSYTFVPPPHNNALNATAIGWGASTRITFASTVEDRSIERRFFAGLRDSGVDVAITTNRG